MWVVLIIPFSKHFHKSLLKMYKFYVLKIYKFKNTIQYIISYTDKKLFVENIIKEVIILDCRTVNLPF